MTCATCAVMRRGGEGKGIPSRLIKVAFGRAGRGGEGGGGPVSVCVDLA